ncbi:hypothetical protein [Dyella mobilis]|uniref:PsbP C-terminal domain-containing protein n=1 Tax=Dyella mobilis TaxID=1849582 RepID=A0ABS2KL94_9GAMM|nr:hypothetical protein [Dyella mobilis]MBM7131931.1 hypothetical protein [Dyella mobilis]GLQ96086.1 hypothetical protein GCM10007863_05040 [Dyella mobilis]
MNFRRYTMVTAVLALASIAVARADDVSMASGSVHFSTPSSWVGIMQVDGDPEVRVFQVPDPSPSASTTLARVSVTVKQAANLQDFNTYVGGAVAKAKQLKNYQPGQSTSGDQNSFIYTASESGTPYTYVERYWFRNGHAIQLRCARPVTSQAGQDWAATFDKGCRAIATTLGS